MKGWIMDQKGRKSINVQFSKCKKVKINQIKNKPTETKNELERQPDSMLKISFNKSSTKKFEQAVVLAQKIGGYYDGFRCVIMLPDSQILENLGTLKLISGIVQNWKSLHATFRDREINLHKFLRFQTQIKEGIKDYETEAHCNLPNGKPGWGCKFINSPRYHILPNHTKITNNSYWYNYGYFKDEKTWVINKDSLRHVITSHVRKKGIDLCPYFSHKRIAERINSLPDEIIVDGSNFEIHYEIDITKDGVQKIPVNIRHIIEPPKEKQREMLKRNRIEELEFQIGMNQLKGKELAKAKEQLAILKGQPISFSQIIKVDCEPERGYKFSDN